MLFLLKLIEKSTKRVKKERTISDSPRSCAFVKHLRASLVPFVRLSRYNSKVDNGEHRRELEFERFRAEELRRLHESQSK